MWRLSRIRFGFLPKKQGHDPSWINRQVSDKFCHAAKKYGYRTRSAFKLKQIDDDHKFLAPGQKVLDLGCYAGGWSQIAIERVITPHRQGKVEEKKSKNVFFHSKSIRVKFSFQIYFTSKLFEGGQRFVSIVLLC